MPSIVPSSATCLSYSSTLCLPPQYLLCQSLGLYSNTLPKQHSKITGAKIDLTIALTSSHHRTIVSLCHVIGSHHYQSRPFSKEHLSSPHLTTRDNG
ncbi:UNVERIFIED_CONTAM: hypothetical protein FKN15_019017 [Acipenser sinensis]